jgi:catechol 2,3-dioxygenase-like lactoylglutathione lyase family enzyme
MISHVSFGVKDLKAARRFYDAALKPLGYACEADFPGAAGYGPAGAGAGGAGLWLMEVERPVKPDEKSGLHLCLDAESRKAVDAFHAAALKHGGSDNGKPGVRKDYGDNYYAAFAIDPDGYRLEVYCGKP